MMKNLNLNGIKTIKDAFSATSCVWNYDPVNNKWKLQGENEADQKIDARNGFYMIARITGKVYDGHDIIGNLTMNTYYFDDLGNMYSGWITTVDGNKYFFDNSYSAKEGLMVIGWE